MSNLATRTHLQRVALPWDFRRSFRTLQKARRDNELELSFLSTLILGILYMSVMIIASVAHYVETR